MKSLKVALMQLMPTGSTEGNMKKAVEYCRKAKVLGADIALFPEMWSNGYQIPNDINELKSMAIENDGEFMNTFKELAKELDMAIAMGYLESFEPLPKNSLCLFDRHGEVALRYSKVHTCDFDSEINLSQGEDFYVCELDTEGGKVKIGAMICYDREFPESARILMLKGAEIILVPNACPMEINRISQLRARAYENMLGIATCNYPYGQPDCNGHSTAFDGIVYSPERNDSRDTLMIDAGEREGIYMADFPMDEIRDYREREMQGGTYRRPDKYGILLSNDIQPPFKRKRR